MICSFTDRNINGFVFGEMTATGYKCIEMLEQDNEQRGWKAGDLIMYNMTGKPVMRITPLSEDMGFSTSGRGKVKTFIGKTQRKKVSR